jgi:hypothetical protein
MKPTYTDFDKEERMKTLDLKYFDEQITSDEEAPEDKPLEEGEVDQNTLQKIEEEEDAAEAKQDDPT